MEMELTPRQIVEELDRYIVGQKEAKRSVAIALRNRYRRRQLPKEMQDDVIPKNILMIGPTGVGKTEIARRLAKLANAPFIKVEATKFTEVGYVGRDVESIIRDLVECAVRMVKSERMKEVETQAEKLANERILNILVPMPKKEKTINPFGAIFGMTNDSSSDEQENWNEKVENSKTMRERYRQLLADGELGDEIIEINLEDQPPQLFELFSGSGMEDIGMNMQDMFSELLPKKKRKRRVTVREARRLLTQEEANKLLDMDSIGAQAIERCEQSGIVFLDEIDKIAGSGQTYGADVSREGVQRDILPIVEGSTVMTKYGPVSTNHILFIAAGAFHVAKPSDLIPELQGRFPIRVELDSLRKEDFVRILTEPKNALLKQYRALLQTEGLEIEFTEDGIDAIASIAEQVNENTENIGARRLHTILERLLADLSFEADSYTEKVIIDAAFVEKELASIISDQDLSMYIL